MPRLWGSTLVKFVRRYRAPACQSQHVITADTSTAGLGVKRACILADEHSNRVMGCGRCYRALTRHEALITSGQPQKMWRSAPAAGHMMKRLRRNGEQNER